MAACAGPPRKRRVSRNETRISDMPAPVPSSTWPKTMNTKTVRIMVAVMLPRMPAPSPYQKVVLAPSTKSGGTRLKNPGQ